MSMVGTAASLREALAPVPTMAAAFFPRLQKLVVAGGLKQQAESVEFTQAMVRVGILDLI